MAPRRRFDFKFKERVLEYAEQTSGEKAARHFNIDSKRIRYWRKQKEELLSADKGRARLSGGGRKKVSMELEKRLSEWIYSMWDKHDTVSCNMVKRKALEIYPSVSDGGRMFVASRGWLQRFLQRNHLSLHRRSTVTQKDPNLLTKKLVLFVDYVGKVISSNRISEEDIIAMDEASVWFDVTPQGVKSDALKPTGHRRSHFTVVLAAKADGTKLKPFIVFRGAGGGAKTSSAVVASSVNGWMNDALTADWLQSAVGTFSSRRRLLVWDSYRCHISATTKSELRRGYNITTAVIPRGCTKYLQAAVLMWTHTFRQSLQGTYNQWASRDADQEHTDGGGLKAPTHHLLVDWVVSAWDRVDQDMIRRSFKVCGVSVKPDGSEDDVILCFREGQPCAAGREALSKVRRRSRENQCQAAQEEDEEELFNNELVVFDDEEEEGDSDNGEKDEEFEDEDNDHMSWHFFIHQALPLNRRQIIIKEEEQQDGRQSLIQEDRSLQSQPPHVKEEQEELWSSQEGEQLPGLEEADITKFTVTPVPVKSEEDDGEKPPSSQLHQRQTEHMEADGEDCGGPGPARNSDPDAEYKPGDSSEPETDDSEDWRETREPQAGLNSENKSMCEERLSRTKL